MAARSWKYLALCTGALATLGGMAGCADDGVSLHVICPIPPELEDDACIWDPGGDTCTAEGVMNLASTNSYRFSLRVESGLRPRARAAPPQGEPNGIQLRSATVDLRYPNGARLGFDAGVENPFEVVASGYVAPGEVSSIALTVVNPVHAAEFRMSPQNSTPKPQVEQIVVAVKIKGVTNGNQEVTSGEFVWPVRLISKSPLASEGCRNTPYCAGSLGQDSFAENCGSP